MYNTWSVTIYGENNRIVEQFQCVDNMRHYIVIYNANPEYAGNPLEPLVVACGEIQKAPKNLKDWAISRDRPKQQF